MCPDVWLQKHRTSKLDLIFMAKARILVTQQDVNLGSSCFMTKNPMISRHSRASLAQLAEHALRKRMVVGSIPTGGLCLRCLLSSLMPGEGLPVGRQHPCPSGPSEIRPARGLPSGPFKSTDPGANGQGGMQNRLSSAWLPCPYDPPRTRTWNLRLRRPTPYPLGQRAR